MPEQLTVKVTRVFASPLVTPTGGIEARTSIEYMVGPHGPFLVTLPDTEFSAARARQEMENKAREIRALAA